MVDYSRLPKSVLPVHYDILLNPSKCRKYFEGTVDILLEIKQATSVILLNCEALTLTECTFKSQASGQVTPLSDKKFIESEGVVELTFPHQLASGSGNLRMGFKADLTPSMKGFYVSKYKDKKGVEHECLSTQFEPNYARLAFPCFDEPCFKATFEMSIVAEPCKTVLFNTNLKTIEKFDDSRMLYKFERSPKMSTYLVAYIIGDFDVVSTTFVDSNVKVSVYTPITRISTGCTSLHAACSFLSFFNKFFGIDYIMPKLDLVAISDFAFGAMENWGLVTFRENALLVDEKNTSHTTLLYVYLVVAHEISHQWFGNLVTMEWWVDLWLNEGFASWMEYKAVDHCFPHLNVWKKFYLSDYVEALELDAFATSHPIEVEVKRASEIDEIFDAISYCKGASIIRMMHAFVGDDDFTKGIKHYFNVHKFGNVTTKNLWDALSGSSNKPVAQLMSSYTQQTGYPLITAEVEMVGDGGSLQLVLSQKRFMLNYCESNQVWVVPVNVLVKTSDGEKTYFFLLDKPSDRFPVQFSGKLEYVLINPGRVGFYRVFYSKAMLSSITSVVTSLSIQDRLGFLNDFYAFAKSRLSSVRDYLGLVKQFKHERDEDVWEYIAGTFSDIRLMLSNTKNAADNISRFNSFIIGLVKPILTSIGVGNGKDDSSTSVNVKLLRSIIISMLVGAHDQETCATLKSWLGDYLKKTRFIEPEYRTAMYLVGMRDKVTYDELISFYSVCELNEEKVRILRSVGGMKDLNLVTEVMELALTDTIRRGDFFIVFAQIGRSASFCKHGWAFFQKNYEKVRERLHGSHLMGNIIKGVLSHMYDQQCHSDVKAFFDSKPKEHIEKAVSQSLEKMEIGFRWAAHEDAGITEWLSKL